MNFIQRSPICPGIASFAWLKTALSAASNPSGPIDLSSIFTLISFPLCLIALYYQRTYSIWDKCNKGLRYTFCRSRNPIETTVKIIPREIKSCFVWEVELSYICCVPLDREAAAAQQRIGPAKTLINHRSFGQSWHPLERPGNDTIRDHQAKLAGRVTCPVKE